MVNFETIDILSVFEGLPRKVKMSIAKIAKMRRLREGAVLFKNGDAKKEFLIIVSGEIEIYKELDSRKQTLTIFRQDQFLSEAAIIGNGEARHFHGAAALEPSEILAIKDKDWFRVMEKNSQANGKILENIIKELEERLFYANNKLVGFFRVSEIIGRYALDLDGVTEEIFRVIGEIIPCQKGILALYQNSNNKLIIKASRGYPKTKKIKGLQIPTNEPIAEEVLAKKKSLIINLSGELGQETQYGKDSVLAAPIMLGDEILGLIILGDKLNRHDFNLNNQILVELVGRQLGLAISQAKMRGERRAEEELRRVYVG